jgi:hypothetical protein
MPRSLPSFAVLFTATVVSLCVASSSSMARAQQNGVLAELYGSGVHAYHSNDYAKAFDLLTRAIDGGLSDPRAYYFRGLTRVATGRPSEAEADFRAGAEIEALGTFGPAIGRSLTRVQGTQRLQIELIRQQARLEKKTEATAQSQRRYGEVQQAEARVLREPPQPRTPPTLPGRRAPVVAPADVPTPFDDDAMATREPTVQARDALEDAMVDPFADEAPEPGAAQPGAAAPADDDPFGGGGTAPAADPFGAPPAGDDPFGAPPEGDDPFAP